MNYLDTFILVAEDCLAERGIIPITKEGKPRSHHAIQYAVMMENPYELTQEDILFLVYAERNSISHEDTATRANFFEKNHPCLRASALPKKYGWGVHFDSEGKAALYSRDSSDYKIFASGQKEGLKLVKAMRNKRAYFT